MRLHRSKELTNLWFAYLRIFYCTSDVVLRTHHHASVIDFEIDQSTWQGFVQQCFCRFFNLSFAMTGFPPVRSKFYPPEIENFWLMEPLHHPCLLSPWSSGSRELTLAEASQAPETKERMSGAKDRLITSPVWPVKDVVCWPVSISHKALETHRNTAHIQHMHGMDTHCFCSICCLSGFYIGFTKVVLPLAQQYCIALKYNIYPPFFLKGTEMHNINHLLVFTLTGII